MPHGTRTSVARDAAPNGKSIRSALSLALSLVGIQVAGLVLTWSGFPLAGATSWGALAGISMACAGVTLGGLGTIWGALVGSMIIGIMVEVGTLEIGWWPGVPSSIKEVGALFVLILILLIRPQGILGRAERIG